MFIQAQEDIMMKKRGRPPTRTHDILSGVWVTFETFRLHKFLKTKHYPSIREVSREIAKSFGVAALDGGCLEGLAQLDSSRKVRRSTHLRSPKTTELLQAYASLRLTEASSIRNMYIKVNQAVNADGKFMLVLMNRVYAQLDLPQLPSSIPRVGMTLPWPTFPAR
jgi:hypothetical protein